MEHYKELIEALGLKLSDEIVYDGNEPLTNDDGLIFQLYSDANEFDGVYFNPVQEEAIRSDSDSFKMMKYFMNKKVTFLLTALIIKSIKSLREGNKLPTALQFKAVKYTERNAKDFKRVVMALGEAGRTLVSFEVENNVEVKGDRYPSVGVVVNNVVDMIDTIEMKDDSKTLILSAMKKLIKEGINSASGHETYSNYDAISSAYNATIERLNKLLIKVDGKDSKYIIKSVPTVESFEGLTLVERMDPYLKPGDVMPTIEEPEEEFNPVIRKPKARPQAVQRVAKQNTTVAQPQAQPQVAAPVEVDEFAGITFPDSIKTRAQKLYFINEMLMKDPMGAAKIGIVPQGGAQPPVAGGVPVAGGAPQMDPSKMTVAERLAYKRQFGIDPVPPPPVAPAWNQQPAYGYGQQQPAYGYGQQAAPAWGQPQQPAWGQQQQQPAWGQQQQQPAWNQPQQPAWNQPQQPSYGWNQPAWK